MARDQSDPTPIESRDELVAWFAQGEKPASDFRIGTEHEKFGFYEHDLAPVPYEGPRGIGALLEGPRRPHRLGADHRRAAHHRPLRSQWRRGDLARAGRAVRAFRRAAGDAARDRARTARPSRRRFKRGAAARPRFLGLGHSPLWTLAETPVMPKQRYDIMRTTCRRSARAAST